jgi:hypothetical protein
MATLAEIVSLVEGNTELRQRFRGALIRSSWNVVNENPGTTNHANRLALAQKIVLDSKAMNDKYYALLLSNGDIQTNGEASNDALIEYVADVLYNTIADIEAAA